MGEAARFAVRSPCVHPGPGDRRAVQNAGSGAAPMTTMPPGDALPPRDAGAPPEGPSAAPPEALAADPEDGLGPRPPGTPPALPPDLVTGAGTAAPPEDEPVVATLMPAEEAYRGRPVFATARRKDALSRWLPIVGQVRGARGEGYTRGRLRTDVVAGLTVASLTLPSAMAYAEVAGVPVTTGLYTLILPVLAYAFLSSSPRTVVGPEGTVALVTGAAVAPLARGDPGLYVTLVSMLALLTGLVFLLARLATVGWLADYLSQAVLVGYIAGVAVALIVGQIGKLTGIPSAAGNTLQELWGYLTHVSDVDPLTLTVGLASVVVLVAMNRWLPRAPAALAVVVLGILVAWWFDLPDQGLATVGEVPRGLPPIEIPQLSAADLGSLVGPAIAIFLISYSDAILISRAIAAKNRETVDANQELLAFGVSNVAAGLTAGMPIGASGSRTAVNDAMRVTSQVGGLINVLAVTAILLFLVAPIEYLPTAVLAAIIIVASIGIIEAKAWVMLHRSSRAEVGIAIVTMLLVLTLGVLYAIVVAVALSIADVTRRAARPHDAVQGFVPSIGRYGNVSSHPDAQVTPGIVVYRLDDRIFFANAHRVGRRIWAAIEAAPQPVRWLVFDAAGVPDSDSAAQSALTDLMSALDARGIGLVVAVMRQSLRDDLEAGRMLELIGEDNIFETVEAAVAACVRRGTGVERSAGAAG
jgi:high affinity sulfate transporter 1